MGSTERPESSIRTGQSACTMPSRKAKASRASTCSSLRKLEPHCPLRRHQTRPEGRKCRPVDAPPRPHLPQTLHPAEARPEECRTNLTRVRCGTQVCSTPRSSSFCTAGRHGNHAGTKSPIPQRHDEKAAVTGMARNTRAVLLATGMQEDTVTGWGDRGPWHGVRVKGWGVARTRFYSELCGAEL